MQSQATRQWKTFRPNHELLTEGAIAVEWFESLRRCRARMGWIINRAVGTATGPTRRAHTCGRYEGRNLVPCIDEHTSSLASFKIELNTYLFKAALL